MAAPSTLIEKKTPDPSGGLHLVVMGPDEFASHPLPAAGEIVIGRGAGIDVTLADPLASRRHARLRVGATLEVEDLGSANGTRVHQTRLQPGQVARFW